MTVTILIPCYNVGAFLPQCLDSILRQTYRNLQVVLIDDGSKDNTFAVAQEYASKDSRVEAYHQENQGVATTRNNLLDKIKGDYFLFIDSDDWIEPNMVEFLLSLAQKNNADMVTCDLVINETRVSPMFRSAMYNREQAIERFLYHTEFRGSLCNKLTCVTLLHNEPRFHRGISYGEDALFCWELLKVASRVIYTSRQLYHYRMNDTSISHQPFGDKKLTGHLVWSMISDDTSRLWPQYLHIAQARWGMEDMYLLRQAGQSNYPFDDKIRQLQQTMKNFLSQMKSTGLLKGREIFNANMMCRWYGYSVMYSMLNKFKQLFL